MTQWNENEERVRRARSEGYLDGYREGFWAGQEVSRMRAANTLHAALARMLDRMEKTKKDLGI